MNSIRLTVFLLVITASSVSAQTTALDWTKTDCDGVQHTLFAELDAGNVVIMEFAMIPSCQPCITAAKSLGKTVAGLPAEMLPKVKLYSIAFDDGYDCQEMKSWKDNNKLQSIVFDGGAEQVAQYGGMGMPTVVIAAGSDHKVIYRKKGFALKDTVAIKTAIMAALSQASIKTAEDAFGFAIYPNPASGTLLRVESPVVGECSVVVTDLLGNRMFNVSERFDLGTNTLALPSELASGSYYLQLSILDRIVTLPFIVQ